MVELGCQNFKMQCNFIPFKMVTNKSSRKVGKTGEAIFLGVQKGGTILINSKWPQYANECTFHSYDVIARGTPQPRHYFGCVMLKDTSFLLTYMNHSHSVKNLGYPLSCVSISPYSQKNK